MSETLFFHIGRKKFMENVNIKPSFSQYLVTIFFSNLFSGLISIITKKVNQVRNSVSVVSLALLSCFVVHSMSH